MVGLPPLLVACELGGDVEHASGVRKLQVGELLEIQGAIQKDDSLGLERVRCKALVDGASGWVTVRAKNGVEYLTAAKKPYLWCAEELPLRSQRSSDEVIRQLVPGECLELVEGPKEDKIGKERRLRGVACGDETSRPETPKVLKS
eukprot:s7826_g1.t1